MTANEFERIADAFTEQGDACWWHFEVRHITSQGPGCLGCRACHG
jgi:hypothetical protein